jgi:restriction system protein
MLDLTINWWDIFFKLWPIWAILAAILFLRIFLEIILPNWFHRWQNYNNFIRGERWRSDRDLIRSLRGMKPDEFEEYIAELFSRLGFKAEAIGRSHDGGIDVIAEKDGIKHHIQCKKFITQEVGVGAVRDFYGAIADHLAKGKGYFITTNKFTLEAEKFAEDKPIELIDEQKLIKYIRLAEKESGAPKLSPEEANRNKCPQCGGNLIKKDGKFGKFYGCSSYPKCSFTKEL